MAQVATMRFNSFTFPYNPERIEISYDRAVARHSIPFGTTVLQEIEVRPRVIRGEGEWIGPQCIARFAGLEAEFYRGGAGRLICPVIGPLTVYFTSLRAIGRPGPLALRYAFEFLEQPAAQAGTRVSWEPSGREGLPAGLSFAKAVALC